MPAITNHFGQYSLKKMLKKAKVDIYLYICVGDREVVMY